MIIYYQILLNNYEHCLCVVCDKTSRRLSYCVIGMALFRKTNLNISQQTNKSDVKTDTRTLNRLQCWRKPNIFDLYSNALNLHTLHVFGVKKKKFETFFCCVFLLFLFIHFFFFPFLVIIFENSRSFYVKRKTKKKNYE